MERWGWTSVITIFLGLVAAISFQKFLTTPSQDQLNISTNQTSDPREYVQFIISSRLDLITRFRFAKCSKSTWRMMTESGFLPPEFTSGQKDIKLNFSRDGWHLFYKEKGKKVTMYLVQEGKFPRVFKQHQVSDLDRRWDITWVDYARPFEILIKVPGAVNSGNPTRIVDVIQVWGPGFSSMGSIIGYNQNHG